MPSPDLRLQLFGSLALYWRGEDVKRAAGLRACHILACLALHAYPLTRRELAGILWPEQASPETREAQLRQALYLLGKTCDAAFLEQLETSGVLQLPRSLIACDLWEWEAAMKKAKERDTDAAWAAAIAPLNLGLFSGKGTDWMERYRLAWNRRFAEALRSYASRVELDDPEAAEKTFQRALALAPRFEALYRDRMRRLALQGRREEIRPLYEALAEELGGVMPSLETCELVERLSPLPRTAVSAPPRLPARAAPPAPFTAPLPRPSETEAIRRLLLSARLVHILGPGGLGKTRLALDFLEEHSADWRDGGVFVALDSLSPDASPADVAERIALALALTPAGDPHGALSRQLQSAQLLLVLDNAEHVRASTAEVLRTLLAECGGISTLVTTREALGVSSQEESYRLPGLTDKEAVALFQLRSPLTPASDERGAAAICHLLCGLPLAVELAAARVRELGSVGALFQKLEGDGGFRELRRSTKPRSEAERRHLTLEAMLRWSISLLTEAERTTLAALGAFRGGASEAALAYVADLPLSLIRKAAKRIGDASLATQVGERLVPLELIRQFAGSLAQESGQEREYRERHAAWFAERARAGLSPSEDQDGENLRLALENVLHNGDARSAFPLADALWPRWRQRGGVARGIALLDQALKLENPPGALFMGRGILGALLGRFEEAARDMDRAEEKFRESGDDARLASLLANRGNLALDRGDLERGEACFTEAKERFVAQGDRLRAAMATGSLGRIAVRTGKPREAIALHAEARQALRELGDTSGALLEGNNLAFASLQAGGIKETSALLREIYREAQSAGSVRASLHALALGVLLAAAVENWERAASLFGAVEALEESSGLPVPASAKDRWEKVRERCRRALGDEAFGALLLEGRSLPESDSLQLL